MFDTATPSRAQELIDPFGAELDQIGFSVAVDGGTVVAGAPTDDGRASNAGAVHVFADLPDSLLCGGVAATQVGTAGDDTLTGTAGRDVIRGYGGDDTSSGLGGDVVICDDDGNDVVLGGPGDDTLFGEAGSDRLLPETGNDTAVGGTGSDIVDYLAADGPIHADPALGVVTYVPPGGPWTHTLVAVEKVDGTRFADTIRGDAKRNVLRGKQGVDQSWGGGGDDDLLIGGLLSHRGAFANVIDGGSGTDVCR